MTSTPMHFVSTQALLQVGKNKVVTLKYALFDGTSQELLEYRTDLIYLHGAAAGSLPRLQAAVEGLRIGMKCEVGMAAEEAFGNFDSGLLITERRADLPPEAQTVGATLESAAEDGRTLAFRVTKVEGDSITLNANHPFAGRSLRFVVEVVGIRAATAAELMAGYALRLNPADPLRTSNAT